MRLRRPILLALLLGALPCAAAEYYVAPGGDDAASGAIGQPWATLQHAVQTVVPGDTIWVRAGTYPGCRIESACTQALPCALRAYPGEAVLLNAPGPSNRHQSILELESFSGRVQWWTVEGFEVAGSPRYGVDQRNTDHVTVRGCTVHGSAVTGIFTAFANFPVIEGNESYLNGEHGIYHSNSGDDAVIRANRLHHNVGCGVHMNGDISMGGDGTLSRLLVERNVIWENGTGGGGAINCDGVTDSVIRNNLCYANHASGITLYTGDGAVGSSRNKVYNNTVVMAPNGRWVVLVSTGDLSKPSPAGNEIRNNILYTDRLARGSISIYSPAETPIVSDDNIVVDRFSADDEASIITLAAWQALGFDLRSRTATLDELFVDAANNDYRLKAGSPALDAGASLADVPEDLLGTARPQGSGWDIGCYEEPSSALVAGPVTGLRFTERATMVWDPAANATVYDLLRGLLSLLHANAGIGDASCLLDDVPALTASDPALPPDAEGWYYLVRGDGAAVTAGTYDTQAGEGRDGEVGTSGGAPCPDLP